MRLRKAGRLHTPLASRAGSHAVASQGKPTAQKQFQMEARHVQREQNGTAVVYTARAVTASGAKVCAFWKLEPR